MKTLTVQYIPRKPQEALPWAVKGLPKKFAVVDATTGEVVGRASTSYKAQDLKKKLEGNHNG